MATIRQLALRVLQKLTVVAAAEAGEATDLELVEQKLHAVHAYLKTENLVRWTMQDLPDYAEEPYVMMAAFLAAPDFERAPNAGMWVGGQSMIQSAVSLKQTTTVHAEYF